MSQEKYEKLRELEEKLWIPKYRFDFEWMNKILADDFFEYGRSGRIYSRKDCLNISPEAIDAVLPLTDFKARYISDTAIQVTYKSIVTYEGEKQYGLRSSIWVWCDGEWKLKFHQGTAVTL